MKIELPQYEIHLKNNALKKLSAEIKKVYKGNNIFIITDQNVLSLYKDKVESALSNFNLFFIITKDKTADSYFNTIEQLLNKNIKKDDLIAALGGGTVGDLAGFVAATLFRGINYIQIPTTLLAQIDSSVGGKTAIDLKEGKNLVGSFYNPKLVFIDTSFLETLSKEEYSNGFAEAIKMAITLDEQYYNQLRLKGQLSLLDIKRAIELKKEVVTIDLYDIGARRVLNFGHTFGHAIEKSNNYKKYKHGQAISYGMLMSLALGIEKGITPKYLYDDLAMVLLKNGLVSKPFLNRKLFIDYIKYDKKQDKNGINFVFVEDIGKTQIINLKRDEL